MDEPKPNKDEPTPGNSASSILINTARGLAGAALGGTAGFFVTSWFAQQGIYTAALPGAGLGLGAGLLVTKRCPGVAIMCGLLALALGLFTYWKLLRSDSFGHFLTRLGNLQPVTLIMLGLGALFGYWLALGLRRKS